MPSAIDFFPLRIKSLTNFDTSRSWNFGSGKIFRLATTRRRGISVPSTASRFKLSRNKTNKKLTRSLGSVLGARLLSSLNPHRIESSADDVIADAGKIFNTASPNHHHRVLL